MIIRLTDIISSRYVDPIGFRYYVAADISPLLKNA